MLGQDRLVNIWKCVPGLTPNLWILSFLSEDETRVENVLLFKSRQGCINHLNTVMQTYKNQMLLPHFCIEEACTSAANYMCIVVTKSTTVIDGDNYQKKNYIDIERVVAFSTPYVDYHELMGIEHSLAINVNLNIESKEINE